VYRGGLLRTLQRGIPSDCIQYNSAVESIVQDESGEHKHMAIDICHVPACSRPCLDVSV